MRLRKLSYDSELGFAIEFLRELKHQGKDQHIERIRARCMALVEDAEEQADVEVVDERERYYRVKISGLELEDFQPDEGYWVEFILTDKRIIIIDILFWSQHKK